MDTDSMRFCYEEHFPTYESSDFFVGDDETENTDELFTTMSDERYWDWEVEQELNGDIALIPMSSNVSMKFLSTSPPAREDFQKIMSEWQQFMNSEVSELEEFTSDIPLTEECNDITPNNVPTVELSSDNILCFHDKQINSEDNQETVKLDVEDDEVNVEYKLEPVEHLPIKDEGLHDSENDFIDVDTVSDQATPILQAGDLDSLLEQFEATQCYQQVSPAKEIPLEANNDVDKNKQILDALPQELIMKIKASSKRRVVPVIDAIPNKKRPKKGQEAPIIIPEVTKTIKTELIQLDHDYCSQMTPYPKHPQKDSGFESAEEDEQRSIFRKQPTVKGADGKLMVSLLKVNTIRNSIITENKTKRKLNLEEYKKRRQGLLRSRTNFQNNALASGGTSSPVVEDESVRLLKHQQKLMQMAKEVLTTPPKSAVPASNNLPVTLEVVTTNPPPPRIPPNNIEVKTLVSMGVNTDISNTAFPTTELAEIKPILKNATTKIDDNSLITSVLQNIQKKKLKSPLNISQNGSEPKELLTHGEDKTIVYLDKCRPPVTTRTVEVQTEPEVEDTSKHKRKRSTSSSSDTSDHRKTYKRRSGSNDSRYSCSSQSSSSSRSRSRSPRRVYTKNRYNYERERVKEVEERRIVYVGGISSSTSKDALRKRFQVFGPISNVSVHFREYGDNYGFVTYLYKTDAYKAVEHGNDDPQLPKYDLSFGGRRIFCRTHYADLDNVQDEKLYPFQNDDSFDNLLREAKAKLRKRKCYT